MLGGGRRRGARLLGAIACATLLPLLLSACFTPPGPRRYATDGPESSGASSASASPGATATFRFTGSPSASAVPSSGASESAPAIDLHRYSVDDPTSIWVVVDKRRPLQPASWVPKDLVQPDVPHTNTPRLRRPAARALEDMVAAAADDGVRVVSLSAYRAYTVQKSIFERNLASMGRAATERLTARPGYSEHQTGLADDLGDGSGRCPIADCFASTPAGRWLRTNAWRYGFILRYPPGQQAETGIQSEPWHYRYVGTDLARYMHDTDQPILERVLGLPPSPDYR